MMQSNRKSLGLLVALYLFVTLNSIRDGSCACPTVGDIELSSDARIFDGSLTGLSEPDSTHVARLGETVIFTCNIQETGLAWLGSVVGGLSDLIIFNSSVMPGTPEAEETRRGGAVVATLTEAIPTDCRTSTLSVDTSRVAQDEGVTCSNQAQNIDSDARLFVTEPPPSPSNIMLSRDTCTSVGVEWTGPATSDLLITNYTVTVTDLDNGTNVLNTTETGTSASLTGLMMGVNYRVEIVSNDVIGPGGSDTKNFTIDPLMPPTNVEYQLECRTSTQAQINWQLPNQGQLTPPPNVTVCWRENGGAEECSDELPPGTTMYTVTTIPNSNYTVRVELDNGCSTEDSSLGDIFDAAVIQDVEVTRPTIGAVAFNMEFAECVENTMTWDVEVSYRPITGICPGDSISFDYPVDLTQREEFNVNCTRDYSYTVTVTDGSGTQVGEANAGMFITDAVPFDCDPDDLGGTVDSATDSECSGVLAGSIGSATIPNGVVCYNGTIVGSLANYSCDEDFQLVPEGATNPRVCPTSGMWSGSDIFCSPNCDPSVLGTVDNSTDSTCDGELEGSIGASIANGVVCFNGTTALTSVALYICDDGYELLIPDGTTNPRECQVDGNYSGSAITCILSIQDCDASVLGAVDSPTGSTCAGVLDGSVSSASIDNGVVCYNGTTGSASVALYICDDESQIQIPDGTTNPRKCEVDGMYSGSDITCSQGGDSGPDSNIGATAGGVVGGVVAVGAGVGIVILIVVLVKKKKNKSVSFASADGRGSGSDEERHELQKSRIASDSGDTRSSPEAAAAGGDLNYAVPGDIKREEYPGTHDEYALVDKSKKKLKPEDTMPTYAAPETIPRERAPETGDLYTKPDKPKKDSQKQAPPVPPPQEAAPMYSEADKSKKQPGVQYADVELPGSNTAPPQPPRVNYSSVQY